jgi:hypothetical protein
MRYLFGFMCVLALGVIGCGETTGTGGTAGDGGGAGEGGHGGGVVSDCAGVEDLTECKVGENEGMCIEGGCVPVDCDGLKNGTECLFVTPLENAGAGFCEEGTCTPPVEDCTGEPRIPATDEACEPGTIYWAACTTDGGEAGARRCHSREVDVGYELRWLECVPNCSEEELGNSRACTPASGEDGIQYCSVGSGDGEDFYVWGACLACPTCTPGDRRLCDEDTPYPDTEITCFAPSSPLENTLWEDLDCYT